MSDETPRTVEVPIEPEELPPHSLRSWVLFGLIGIAVVGMIAIIVTQRIMSPPTRGDVDVDSVVTLQNASGQWDVIAMWSTPAPGGCVVLGWKVVSGDRGYEVASQQMAPPDAAFPAARCAFAFTLTLTLAPALDTFFFFVIPQLYGPRDSLTNEALAG